MQIRVYYEDTDCGNVVYYANYLKFCERARSELFFQKGLSPHKDNEFFVVKSVQADYIKSAVFGDLLDIKTKITQKKSASLEMYQEIYKDDVLLFKATFKLAFLKNYKPTKIPESIWKIFQGENS
uniref:YbgC/FadM family acyl-CoA thioesterase n=1 Tax=Aliarcobacter sp. TaxID=2321116 RepID=UPI004048E1A4